MDAALVERDAAIAAVRATLDAAASGRGQTLFVLGEAGLGKTSILRHAIDIAGSGFHVGTGRGDVVESALPFGLAAQAVGPLVGADVFDPHVSASSAGRILAVLHRLQQVATAPLLIALDDLHWSDPDSITLIHVVCRRLAELPIAVIAAARPWPDQALRSADELAGQALAVILTLQPLSAAGSTSLLRERCGSDVSPELIEPAVIACAGNPLLLDMAAAAVRAGERGPSAEPLIGEAGRRFLRSRFLGITAPAYRYAQVASVLGNRFRHPLVAEVGELSPAEAADGADVLFQAGLLREGVSGWYEYRHELIRQALYEEIPPPRRAALHEAAFRSLLARDAAPAEAAEQALAAGLHGDFTAVAALASAGREALRAGAARAARRYLATAAEQAGAGADPALLIDLGRALTADGAIDLAVGIFEQLLDRTTLDQATRATVQGLAGRAAFSGGDPEQAAGWFAAAVRTAADGHPVLAAQAQLDHAFVTWVRLGPQAALPLAVRAGELAGEDLSLRAGADATRALCSYLIGDPMGLETAEAVAGASRMPGDPLDTSHWALEPAGVPGDVAVWAERFEKAEVLFGQLLIDAERSGNPFAAFHASFSWSEGLWRLGRLGEALAMADRVEEIADLLPIAAPFAAATKAMTYLEIGDLNHARQHAERLAYLARGNPWFLVQGYDLHRRATLALRLGAVEEAGRLFTTLEQRCDGWGVVDMAAIPWAPGAIQAHLARERPDDARRVLTRVEQAAAQLPSRWPKLVAATGRGLLAERDGDREQAAAHFDDVLHLQANFALPLPRAEALTTCGAFWNRCGDARRARPILAEAQRIAEGCGAGWHIERARVEWRRAGGRAGGAAPDQLTPQETQVVRLARAGRTNRQIAQDLFLSVNTVETHLAHAYRKLGIRRRWELIARDGDL